jgi:hypothetical protein
MRTRLEEGFSLLTTPSRVSVVDIDSNAFRSRYDDVAGKKPVI